MTYKVQIDDLVRDATADEIVQLKADQAKYEAEKATQQAETQAKATAKAELLQRLGITADEAKLLLA